MAYLNQFQSYSQKENTVTNNVLLMLSRIYQINPRYYEDYIAALIDDSNTYQAIPSFDQQVGNTGGGIIDGHIQIKPSRIIIETKLNSLENIEKLLKYTRSFDPHEVKILLHLSSQIYSADETEEVQKRLQQSLPEGPIYFFSKTYEELVTLLEALTADHPHETQLQSLAEDFRDYCEQNHLIADTPYILRAMACGQSFDLNMKYQMYFDVADRGYRPFSYLGIYKHKSVRGIGEVENNIEASYDSNSVLEITRSETEVTPDQKDRLTKIMEESIARGWDVGKNHRFFLLKNFQETDFQKSSPGGIFRVKYFNLKRLLGAPPESTKDIALQLKELDWS